MWKLYSKNKAPRFHIGITKWGINTISRNHFEIDFERWPFPYGDGSFTNLFWNRGCDHLRIDKNIPKWECFPIWIHRFHMAIPVCKWAGRFKNSHLGTPRSEIEFVTIWGLTYIQVVSKFNIALSTLLCQRKHVKHPLGSSCLWCHWYRTLWLQGLF